MKNIEQEIEKTLSALNHTSKASPSAYFITRLMGRVDKTQASIGFAGIKWFRPYIAFGIPLLFIALNIYTLFYGQKNRVTAISKASTNVLEEVASYYDLQAFAY